MINPDMGLTFGLGHAQEIRQAGLPIRDDGYLDFSLVALDAGTRDLLVFSLSLELNNNLAVFSGTRQHIQSKGRRDLIPQLELARATMAQGSRVALQFINAAYELQEPDVITTDAFNNTRLANNQNIRPEDFPTQVRSHFSDALLFTSPSEDLTNENKLLQLSHLGSLFVSIATSEALLTLSTPFSE